MVKEERMRSGSGLASIFQGGKKKKSCMRADDASYTLHTCSSHTHTHTDRVDEVHSGYGHSVELDGV